METIKYMVLVVMLATMVTSAPTNGANRVIYSTGYCRYFKGLSSCVQLPLPYDENKLFCPYHMCGPGFINATKCIGGDNSATHVCRIASQREIGYRCKANNRHKTFHLPIGCRDDSCKTSIRTCRCKRIARRRRLYTEIRPITDSDCE